MSNRLALCLVLFSFNTAFAADAPTAGKTGDFTVNFTQRSPLTNLKELSTRFAQKNLSPDYDLSSQQFLVHVPANYDPDKPMGLIVLINYKSNTQFPRPVLPIFDERNLAFITESNIGLDWWVKCGEALDAAYNMRQLYKIDPKRTYIFSFTNEDNCGLRLITCYSDVFNGALLCQEWGYWTQLSAADGLTYPAKIPHPPVKYFGLSKSHPILLVSQLDDPYFERVGKALKADGFKHSKISLIAMEDYHFPNWKAPWLNGVLDFLDSNIGPATHPTSKPSQ